MQVMAYTCGVVLYTHGVRYAHIDQIRLESLHMEFVRVSVGVNVGVSTAKDDDEVEIRSSKHRHASKGCVRACVRHHA